MEKDIELRMTSENRSGFIGTHNAGALLPTNAEGQRRPMEGYEGPPIGTVVRFKIDHGGRYYDYAAVRAGDGKWYITGGDTKQGVSWAVMTAAIKPKLSGPIMVMSDRTGIWL